MATDTVPATLEDAALRLCELEVTLAGLSALTDDASRHTIHLLELAGRLAADARTIVVSAQRSMG